MVIDQNSNNLQEVNNNNDNIPSVNIPDQLYNSCEDYVYDNDVQSLRETSPLTITYNFQQHDQQPQQLQQVEPMQIVKPIQKPKINYSPINPHSNLNRIEELLENFSDFGPICHQELWN